ncbi:filamentous hemagglutinin N-terminal domain-containing protein (plasmid) [Nostoc sp. UHCC 0302]|uniref:filamentous hemagglutinin N-terminal domain-containing protein n=1 Tax=Nostoc sp. UHCC 0302 TaxID=3134896 RepID=UPI00311CDCF1
MKLKSEYYQRWKSLLFGFGTITLTGCYASATFVTSSPVNAQIVPDNTLPINSSVTPGCTACTIEGGTVRGSNLFHSFRQFSIPTGGEAFFNNPTSIENIFTRVTGNSISNIDGLIRANGTANLFFLNPNGIFFGKNATLNIGGSFIATTANAIGFGNQGFFNVTLANSPGLLTIDPSALLFNQVKAGSIHSQSIAPAGLDPAGYPTYGLRVANGNSLLLVGGDINIDGLEFRDPPTGNISPGVNGNRGGLKAFGGRVELGGLAGIGSIGLEVNGKEVNLSFPNDVALADVSLTNKAEVNVRAVSGGNITVNAHNIDMSGSSQLMTGIALNLGSPQSRDLA